MKRFPLFFLLIFMTTLASAQGNDTKAAAILDDVINKSKTYTDIKADFTYKLENKTNKVSDSYSGTALIKGEKYKLTIAGQTVIYNNNTTWTY
jgi:outer membrane lipoprotein-sorting protein